MLITQPLSRLSAVLLWKSVENSTKCNLSISATAALTRFREEAMVGGLTSGTRASSQERSGRAEAQWRHIPPVPLLSWSSTAKKGWEKACILKRNKMCDCLYISKGNKCRHALPFYEQYFESNIQPAEMTPWVTSSFSDISTNKK